jgi:hypothetical protein
MYYLVAQRIINVPSLLWKNNQNPGMNRLPTIYAEKSRKIIFKRAINYLPKKGFVNIFK